ncbi:MAG: class I SAM-dependent methyltransferase [Alphaproteobacteria bacterium]|nr:class I SAM-dependent methyltransferase [Alphaproteobacteria bacterium]
MIDWAAARIDPVRVVDPGAGSGRFAIAAALRWPRARVLAIDTDEAALTILAANARAAGVDGRIDIRHKDFIAATIGPAAGPTLFLGNPPFVRHHHLSQPTKSWWHRACGDFDERASGLAGLHNLFFVRTLQLAAPGDLGCFVAAAEWLDTNYGATLRRLCAGPLGLEALFLADPAVALFPDVMTRAGIFCFHPHRPRSSFSLAPIADTAAARLPTPTRQIEAAGLSDGAPWRFDRAMQGAEQTVLLGDLFRASRGQATGMNRVWILGDNAPQLPSRFCTPAITGADDITRLRGRPIGARTPLKCVANLPRDLSGLTRSEHRQIDAFIAWAAAEGADRGYLARHRKPWWAVRLPPPPAAFVTYMARKPPVFALNDAGASMLNICHGLYPRQPMARRRLARILAWLNANVALASGRTYAGGLVKFEPKEIERLTVPAALLS